MGILKFDEIKTTENIYYNPHTYEIIRFKNGAHNIYVLMKEMNA